MRRIAAGSPTVPSSSRRPAAADRSPSLRGPARCKRRECGARAGEARLPGAAGREKGRAMRRLALPPVPGAALLPLAPSASAVTISNGTVELGLNPGGDLNDQAADVGLTYVPT